MGEHGRGPSLSARVWWLAALVGVPLALAGTALLWPGPQLADDLRGRAESALEAAGLGPVSVSVTGRDALLDGVPSGAERAAVETVSGVPGVRAVEVGSVAPLLPPPPAPPQALPSGSPPVDPPDALSAAARQQLADRLGAVVGAAPITFAPDRAELDGPAAATVRRVGELLAAEPAGRVDVDGYVADTPGGPEIAQRLSDERAAVVADALVAAGVARDHITARGRGATRPLDTRAASRRVEISVR